MDISLFMTVIEEDEKAKNAQSKPQDQKTKPETEEKKAR